MFSKEKKGRIILGMMAGAVIFTASATTTGAYLTRTTDSLKNVLAPGKLTVEVKEPGWQEKSGESVLPAESRTKNPLVKNSGTLDSWMFLEVEIPVKTISLVDLKTHRKQPETRTELFTFEANKNWELLERTEEENSVRYVYGYRELIAPQQETEKLFETITAVSYLEGSLDDQEVFRIPVTAQAIQKNIAPEGTSLKEIYQIYLEQQGAERSAEA